MILAVERYPGILRFQFGNRLASPSLVLFLGTRNFDPNDLSRQFREVGFGIGGKTQNGAIVNKKFKRYILFRRKVKPMPVYDVNRDVMWKPNA